ncbi:MAG: hypothetical protein MJD61_19655 [Proteobacteria bacterium]|nr:hypothetical protein [Pseudomonadota bacterium]
MRRLVAPSASVALFFVGTLFFVGVGIAAGQDTAPSTEQAQAQAAASTEAAAKAGATSEKAAPAPGATGPQLPGGSPARAAPTVDASKYSVRLRDLEQRVNELKEQIFRSKARLSLLAETVLQGVVAGAQAKIIHENKMGSSYKLVRVVYALDGAPIFNKADESGALGDRDAFDVYNGSIVPGEHTLTVKLEYRGHGYGIFSYLKGYTFKARASFSFNAPEGKLATLRVVGYERGGPTAPLEERPAVTFHKRFQSNQAGPGEVAQ